MSNRQSSASRCARAPGIGASCLVIALLIAGTGLQGCASEEERQESRENARFIMAVAQVVMDVYEIRQLPSVLELAENAGSQGALTEEELRRLGFDMVYDMKTRLTSASGNLSEWREDTHQDRTPIVDAIDRALGQLEASNEAALEVIRLPTREQIAAGRAALSGGRRELMRSVMKIRVRDRGSRSRVIFPQVQPHTPCR